MTATDKEILDIKESIFIDSENSAIHSIQEWDLSRLLEWDNDLRPIICQHLIGSVSKFNVKPPSLWYDMILDRNKYDSMYDDITDVVVELEDSNDMLEDPDIRPTEYAEKEISRGVV